MKKVIFLEVTPEQLQEQIQNGIEEQLNHFLENYKPKQPEDYLTRNEVAELLSVDLSTIHNWCKKGKLKPLGLGNRVYFLRSEIQESLKRLY